MILYNEINQGTFLRAKYLAEELVKLNQRVTILATSGNGFYESTEKGVRIIGIPSIFRKGLRFGWDPYNTISRMNWLRNSDDFDIIHGFESRPNVIYPALYIKRKRQIPLVLDWCDWFGKGGSVEERPNKIVRVVYRPFETYFENRFRPESDYTTVICRTLFQRALNLGIPKGNISLLYNGFNMLDWRDLPMETARHFFGISASEFVIGYVGSLFPKDAALMERAFRLINQKLPNARLLHIGKSNYYSKENENSVIATGKVNLKVLNFGLAACDICWLPLSNTPANWGRFPLKFSNYLSAGKAVFSTNVGDIPDFIKKYNVGEICQATAEDLSTVVIQSAINPLKLNYYGLNAKNLSNNNDYSWKYFALRLLGCYMQLAK